MLLLRDYQVDARKRILDEWEKGNLGTMLISPMGTGKTEIILSVLAEEAVARRFERALLGVHRKELVYQPMERAERFWSGLLPTPVAVTGEPGDNGYDGHFVCATIQSLASGGNFERLIQRGAFSHLVIDETHHVTAPTYVDLIEKLRSLNPNMRLLGATATPFYKETQRKKLREIFQSKAFEMTLPEAIKIGALVPVIARRFLVDAPLDLQDASDDDDEWGDDENEKIGGILSARNVQEVIVEKWREFASDRPTMVFVASVDQGVQLAKFFTSSGHRFEVVHGGTPLKDRSDIIQRYIDRETLGIINCAVYTEGTDLPITSAVLMACSSRSRIGYAQRIGRGLRLSPGKSDCLVIDFSADDSPDIVTIGDILRKPREVSPGIERKAIRRGTALECFGISADGDEFDVDPNEAVEVVFDLLGMSKLQWTFDGVIASCPVSADESLFIVAPQHRRVGKAREIMHTPAWSFHHQLTYERVSQYQVFSMPRLGLPSSLGTSPEWDDAMAIADDYVKSKGIPTLFNKRSRWRTDDPGVKQIAFATKLGVYKPGMKKGRLAQAITHELARRAAYRERIVLP